MKTLKNIRNFAICSFSVAVITSPVTFIQATMFEDEHVNSMFITLSLVFGLAGGGIAMMNPKNHAE